MLKQQPLTYETAAIIIQKSYRGFFFRKTFRQYKQRLHIQMLCFLQQIELINNDFFTKIVRTNYCVPFKSIESIGQVQLIQKQSNKLFQHLFPPPPPLPLPMKFENFSPVVSRSLESVQIPPPPLPSALLFSSNRSPSPVSKFAQVRDIFARAEAATSIITHHASPIRNPVLSNIISSHTIPSIERSRSPKAASVFNAVQEYQRQHIHHPQQIPKRFIQLNHNGSASANRSPNIGALRSRSITNSNPNNNKLLNKQQSFSAYSTSSPQLQLKSISRVSESFEEKISGRISIYLATISFDSTEKCFSSFTPQNRSRFKHWTYIKQTSIIY